MLLRTKPAGVTWLALSEVLDADTIISDDQDRFRALTLSASATPRIFSFALRSLIQASSP
jgi:hypothetical protein